MQFIVSLFNQPSIMAGLMALIGLIALKKPIQQIISGTLKTIIGFIILQVGATAIANTLGVLGPIFQEAFHMQGVIPTNEAVIGLAQKMFGSEMALMMLFGFLVNLIIARFTPLKYVFLTGHHILFMSGLLAAVLSTAGFKGVELIVVGSLILGSTMVLTPALVQPYYRKVTGNDSVAMGHYNALTYVISAYIGKITGNKEHSTEDIKVPQGLSFFRDNTLSTAIVMAIIFLITMYSANRSVVLKASGGSDVFIFAITQALTFTAGFVVVLQGVRMMLAEIVPAFKGIAEKIVPDAIPALDCPVIFPFAPNAVIIGFLSSLVGGIIMFLILPHTGLAVIIPGLIPLFFVGAAAGVLTNATGGLRGTIIGGIINGAILTLLPALLLPVMGQLGFANSTFGDADFVFTGIVVGYLAKLFTKTGIYALVAILILIFIIVSIVMKPKKLEVTK
ncbi:MULTISPECIES: PTS ascorbate transporter subunit IIC [Thermoanaerobacterium]|uniref:Ascorbate-specific PTS system EIIC component n=2 Tax=Thermoanaerobacterium TaxID=28895 RepID=W9ECS2_9THEO|nr:MULTISPECIES: PTS ascorbate transporter subunit IIC [Thermoanaerobacterium]AFK85299.1 putative sugar-specific permease SgaT/UlaA [Thermoanaerobacterium saccharolyticum JW/SL-YS485]ETO38815.1 putative sugar-specific permease SgaT/UlaA [Thermoanaerobacterium aotearoense SCUT27]